MGKKSTHVKGALAQQPQGGKLATYEHQENYEENLLPDAEELAKLKEVDSTLLPWLISRIEKEQDSRLTFNERQVWLLEKETSRNFKTIVLQLCLAFGALVSGMGLSAYMLFLKLEIAGTVFAGVTLLASVNAFLNFKRNKDTDTP
jgi:uncharacterized membrane protein